MPLFHVQDSDRPMWIVATDWHDAIKQWQSQIATENNGDVGDPLGVHHVCDNDELIVKGVYQD